MGLGKSMGEALWKWLNSEGQDRDLATKALPSRTPGISFRMKTKILTVAYTIRGKSLTQASQVPRQSQQHRPPANGKQLFQQAANYSPQKPFRKPGGEVLKEKA